jgi:hypothetical protein
MVNGIPCSILTKPEMAKQNFVLHQAGFYGLNQSKALAARLLSTGMMKERP